ncbi:MAG: hypothetical protein IPI04_03565 [Ignavibacteria bacterium]|nr:hypothetical protein [Ignavibacteria bacterium]
MKQLTAIFLMLISFITSGLNAQTGGILNKGNVDYSKKLSSGNDIG